MISGQQRGYGEWFANGIRLDTLYASTPESKVTRQMLRADRRATKKELDGMKKRQDRSKKHLTKRYEASATMTDSEMKSGGVTV